MDKQYRMSDVFDLPVPDYVCDEEFLWRHAKDGEHEKADKAAAHAINSHDAMQDRIAELEKLNDELHSLVDKETGLSFTVNNDAVFIDGLGSLPIGTADTVSKQVQRIEELEQKLVRKQQNVDDWISINRDLIGERDQLKAQNSGLIAAIDSHKLELSIGDDPSDIDLALYRLIDKSPAACLAEHDARFLTSLKEKCQGDHPYWGRTHIFIGEQIEQIRQQAQGEKA